MKLDQPFIRLPYQFDAERLALELDNLSHCEWLPHPSGMTGNQALPLVSRDGGSNDDFDGRMKQTGYLADSPYIQQCMHHIDEVYGRSRLMALDPGSEVSRHVDFNYHWLTRVRIHIPVVTNPDVIFYCGDEHVHMEAGSCWIFDSWRHHRVVNGGSERRTHLVLDTAGSSTFWRMVDQALSDGAPAPAIVPYDVNASGEIKTERFNTLPVMAPGEMQALVIDIMNDLEANPGNGRTELERLNQTLNELVHDWRAVWSQYGLSREGMATYESLLKRTMRQLPGQPRTLTTRSNDIGATPIVMQRIVRAALRPELLNHMIQTTDS